VQQTISQAAQLYGKARSTIHRAIDSGRLSCSIRGDKMRVIQLAELIRLWGEPPNAPPQTHQNATAQEEPTQQALVQELRALREELVALREEVALLRRLPAPKVDEVDEVDRPQEPPEQPQEPRQADTLPDDTRGELRGLVAALRQSQE